MRLVLIMISKALYIQILNKNQKIVLEESAIIAAQFRIGVVPYFRWVT
jgi:hypothetical protein